MGSVLSAIRDDEDDWDFFKRKTEITQVEWELYSLEYSAAKKLHSSHKLTGNYLIRAVQQEMIKSAADREIANIVSHYRQAENYR